MSVALSILGGMAVGIPAALLIEVGVQYIKLCVRCNRVNEAKAWVGERARAQARARSTPL